MGGVRAFDARAEEWSSRRRIRLRSLIVGPYSKTSGALDRIQRIRDFRASVHQCISALVH